MACVLVVGVVLYYMHVGRGLSSSCAIEAVVTGLEAQRATPFAAGWTLVFDRRILHDVAVGVMELLLWC